MGLSDGMAVENDPAWSGVKKRGDRAPMKTTVTHRAEARGQGPLTVVDLAAVLAELPSHAVLDVTTGASQRDGSWWRVTGTWTGTSWTCPGGRWTS